MFVFRSAFLVSGLLFLVVSTDFNDLETNLQREINDVEVANQKVVADQNHYTNILEDSLFACGFEVYMVEDGVPNLPLKVIRKFDYDQMGLASPKWQLAQWNNYNNNLKDAKMSYHAPFYIYSSAGGNKVAIDPTKGRIKLSLNTANEYGKNAVNPDNPRKSGQKWPHLLISQDYKDGISIWKLRNLRMLLEYTVTNVVDNHLKDTFDRDIHTAQFQWFIMIANKNINSSGYGDFFWFGFSFYDLRNDFSPFYANVDINTTGKFIYMPDMKEILGEGNQTLSGEAKKVDLQILGEVKKAFQLAKDSGFLAKTTWQDLALSHTNIGWEIPGSFDAACQIYKMAIYIR